jgi:hypothetical protein
MTIGRHQFRVLGKSASERKRLDEGNFKVEKLGSFHHRAPESEPSIRA